MNKGLVFVGILTVFLLLAPYFGIHPFGRPVPSVPKAVVNLPIRRLEDMDLMDPVDSTADLAEGSNS